MHNKKHNKNEEGQVMMLATLFLLAGSMVVVGAVMALVKSQVRVMTELSFSKASYIFTEGALEDVVYRHKTAKQVSSTETLTEGSITVDTVVTTIVDNGKDITATGNEGGRTRKMRALLTEGDGASFSFGVQTDVGGIIMENNSSVNGNIYSNGPITGSNKNDVKGAALSAGPAGSVSEVHATGSVYANNIEDSTVDGDAFYTSIDVATVVSGTKYPGWPDIATSSFPIPEELIDAWADYASSSEVLNAECAAAGGHIVYDYDVTLGPAKIPCDVTFNGVGNITTIEGVLWIEGDLNFANSPAFVIHADIGNKSVPIIVDNPADRLTSGRIDMDNSGSWTGNGDRSYIMLLSRNESAENGGPEKAISIKNSIGGDLLVYAGHGEINLRNNTDLTEITAWRVRLQNFTEVNYDSGLVSAVFEAGPGGTYVIDVWEEVE